MLKHILFILFYLSILSINAQNDTFNILKAGDKAPIFTAKNHDNKIINLSESLQNGKVVLIFYRGTWCPYCNKQMSNLQDSLNLITAKGATIITVSPETEKSINKTITKTNASFNIIHDSSYVIMKKYGVAFKLDELTVKKYKLFGIDLEESNGNKDNILPVPATFIINQDGTIIFTHFDENYKKRLSIKEIITHL